MKNFWIMIIAFLLALTIWVEIKLAKVQRLNIKVPVAITNSPTALIPLSIEPGYLDLTIEGKGREILLYNLEKNSYYIDLKDTHFGNNYKPINYEELKNLADKNLKIVHKAPSKEIIIYMDIMISKLVPVKPTFVDDESRIYFIENSLAVLPENIQVKGPKTLIKDICEIASLPYNIKKQDNLTLNLIHPSNTLITYDKYTVDIKKREPKIIQKTISVIPILSDKSIEIFPNSVSIKISGEEKILQNIQPEDFIAEIDTSVSLEIDSLVAVQIYLPDGVELIAQTPTYVRIKNVQR
ncbi:MAG: hypothetical protein H8D22_01640 [Candidatus Cloacimonetes bacterium]|nr:hypothetical protein [Candidatus Cloacimonadota bacterium]